MRRGDIRTAVLAILTEGEGHGYDIIGRLETKSDGAWRPSPGSVYPTLQLLEDEGLVRAVERDGKRIFFITDEGRAEVARRLDDAGDTPWGAGRGRGGPLREAMMQLHLAAKQVAIAGNAEQADQAAAVINDARRKLYEMLASG